MAIVTCSCCAEVIEGEIYKQGNLMNIVSSKVPPRKWGGVSNRIKSGYRCSKCNSWFCNKEIDLEYSLWVGWCFICPKCKKKIPSNFEIIASSDYLAKIDQLCLEGEISPDERIVFYRRDGNEVAITDKRFLYGYGKPLNSISLNDIESVDSFLGGGIILGKKGGEEVKVEFRRPGEGFYLAADEIGAIRKMCEAIDVPFLIGILSAEEGKELIDYQPSHYQPSQYTLVYYFNGKQIQWPQVCAKCLAPLDTSMVIYDHVKIYDLTLIKQTATHWSLVYSAENLAKQPNTTFDVPYCIKCKGTDTKPAGQGYPVFYSLWSTGMSPRPVKGYLFDFSGSVYLEFLNSEYAQLFVQMNALT
jgi:hypothetical protein